MSASNDKIYIMDADETLHALERRAYSSEADLQALLERHPDLLAGDQMDTEAPRRWVLVSREIGVPGEDDGANRWSLDHLFLDQDGVPTLVEVKRSTDTRIRREVVGQMLDYAANAVVYWPVDRLISAFETTCDGEGNDAFETIVSLVDEADKDGETWERYWQRVKTNLQAGRVRLVFLADVIPPELRRIVEFLNGQMDPAEVVAIEIRQYVGGSLRTLVPRIVGQTAQAEQKKGSSGRTHRQWDRATFLAALEETAGTDERTVAEIILEWAANRGLRVFWGRGKTAGSFVTILDYPSGGHSLLAVYTYGTVELYFQHWHAPFDSEKRKQKILAEFDAIPGLELSHRNLSGRPRVTLAQLRDPKRRDLVFGIFDQMLTDFRAHHELA
ncbi:MAG: hypothetical protein Rubg2KO_00040 [Rubricoccaceae bacterium]